MNIQQFWSDVLAQREGEIFWYPLSELARSDALIDGFGEMLSVFTNDKLSEVYYERADNEYSTVFC